MKVYISGPMSGQPGLNFPTFASAAATLRANGYDVVSPHELDHPGETFPGSLPWTSYLRRDLRAMLECDAIAMLPGWTLSDGARLEFLMAVRVDLELFTYEAGVLVPVETKSDARRRLVLAAVAGGTPPN